MSARFISLLARFLSIFPLSVNRTLGSFIGRITWLKNGRTRRVTETNLRLCFPHLNKLDREKLTRENLQETGKQLTECAWLWHRPKQQVLNHIEEWICKDLLASAVASNRGVIVVSPHIGNWEVCAAAVSTLTPFTYLYRIPRNVGLDLLLKRWRANLDGMPATLDNTGIRASLRILKNGGTIGILPDQEPDLDSGQFSPFFGEPALTMTLLSKLARRSNAIVLLCVCKRLQKTNGWQVQFLEADPDTGNADLHKAVLAVNRDVERCISLCPEQYLWSYKRFNTLKNGSRRDYLSLQP
ncbi:MAG: lysophospholipid acyltransferase family protein [Granulosicoccus sp.]